MPDKTIGSLCRSHWQGTLGNGVQWVGWQWAVLGGLCLYQDAGTVQSMVVSIMILLSESFFSYARQQPVVSEQNCTKRFHALLPNALSGVAFYHFYNTADSLSDGNLLCCCVAVGAGDPVVHDLTSRCLISSQESSDQACSQDLFSAVEAGINAIFYNLATASSDALSERFAIETVSYSRAMSSLFILAMTAFSSKMLKKIQHAYLQRFDDRDAGDVVLEPQGV